MVYLKKVFYHFTLLATCIQAMATLSSEEQFIELAIRNNRQIQATTYLVASIEARTRRTVIFPNPELEVEMESDLLFNNENESAFRIGISQQFPFSNRLQHAASISKLELEIIRTEINEMKWMLAHQVRVAMLDIRSKRSDVELEARMLALVSEWKTFTESRAKTGEVSGLDVSQLGLETAEIRQRLYQLNMEEQLLMIDFKRILGLRIDEPLEWEVEPLSVTYESNADFVFDSSKILRRYDYQSAMLALKSRKTAIELAKSEKWEDFTVGLSLSRERAVDEPFGSSTDHFIGVGFSLPIPLRKGNELAVAEKIAERDRAQVALSAIGFDIEQTIRRAQEFFLLNKKQLEVFESGVLEESTRHVKLNEQAYIDGQIDLPSLLRAQETRLKLERRLNDNIRAIEASRLNLVHLLVEDQGIIEESK